LSHLISFRLNLIVTLSQPSPKFPKQLIFHRYCLAANKMPPGDTSVPGKNLGSFIPLDTNLFKLKNLGIHARTNSSQSFHVQLHTQPIISY